MTTDSRNQPTETNRNLPAGTKVVHNDDGEPGWIIDVCTLRRNGIGVFSYLVETAYGKEVWEASELFVPQNEE